MTSKSVVDSLDPFAHSDFGSCLSRPTVPIPARRGQRVKGHTGLPIARFLRSLARNELIEGEWCRLTAWFANDRCLAQCAQAGLMVLKQPQSRAHDVAGRTVTALRDLLLDDERAVMLVKAE